MPELSIIVPVYNVEAYLGRCIDSVLAQTFTDWELILIDDGSPDNSGKICDEYAAKDKRITVIHKKNGGVSAARNTGIRAARGKYLAFIDSDDWIAPEMCRKMLAKFGDDVDLVCSAWSIVYNSGREQKFLRESLPEMITLDEFILLFYETPTCVGRNACWKLFRKDLITNEFNEGSPIGEDSKFMLDYALNCKNIAIVPEIFYYYYAREGSATSHFKEGALLQALVLYDEMRRKVVSLVDAGKLKKDAGYAAEANILDSCLRSIREESSPAETKELLAYYHSYVRKHFGSMLSNPYMSVKQRLWLLGMNVFLHFPGVLKKWRRHHQQKMADLRTQHG